MAQTSAERLRQLRNRALRAVQENNHFTLEAVLRQMTPAEMNEFKVNARVLAVCLDKYLASLPQVTERDE